MQEKNHLLLFSQELLQNSHNRKKNIGVNNTFSIEARRNHKNVK